jgi:phosphoribosylformylglycinamidine synthase subunit PurL
MIRLPLDGLRRDALLFGESQSRVILTVKADVADEVLNRAWDAGIPAAKIGAVGGDRLMIDVPSDDRTTGCTIDVEVRTLRDRWANTIEKALKTA